MSKTGISALIDVGAWFEDGFGGEVLSIGRPAEEPIDCSMEMVGANLAYRIVLSGTFVAVYAHSVDKCQGALVPPLAVNDDRPGWRLAVKLLRQLEESKLRNLRQTTD